MFDLSNKTIIVTGASGLIGSAIVRVLRTQNATVIPCDIRGDTADPDVRYFNLSRPQSIQPLFEGNMINGFVECTYPRDFKTATEHWLTLMEWVAREMASQFSADQMQQGGSIVTIGSIYGLVGAQMNLYDFTAMDMPTSYAFFKGGVISTTRTLATKYGKYNIRCNTVCPGGVENHQPQEFIKRYEAKTPMGRMAVPEDIAGPVAFLLSDAARYVTGIVLTVDGGLTAW